MQTNRESDRLFKIHYPELELVRAVAIILVMLFHYSLNFPLPVEHPLTMFFRWGFHGVDLFFVLSGFLIGGQIIEDTLAGGFNFKIFYFKRFLRIFPAYYFSIFVFVLVYTTLGNSSIGSIAKDLIVHVLYLQNLITPSMYGGLYWTLAVEEQFYLVIPVLLFVIIRYLRKHLFIGIIAVLLLIRAIGVTTTDLAQADWLNYSEHTLRGFGDIISGVVAAYIYISYKERLQKAHGVWRALILLLCVFTLWWSLAYSGTNKSHTMALINFSMTSIGFSALVLYMTICSAGRYIPFKRGIGVVARLSYTMYLYHTLVAILLKNFGPRIFAPGVPGFPHFFKVFVLYFLVVLFTSAVMYLVIEMPCLKYRNRVLVRRQKKSTGL